MSRPISSFIRDSQKVRKRIVMASTGDYNHSGSGVCHNEAKKALTTLKRNVGLYGAASVGIANIIGAGIFVLSGVAAGLAGGG